MATPSEIHHHEHFADNESGTGAGIWALVAVLIVLLALLLFGSNLFNRQNSGTNIQGEVNVPASGGSQSQ